MARVSKYEPIVLNILTNHAEARDDDRRLYYWVLRSMGFDTNIPLSMFLSNPAYPNWESVTRVRRKLQERYRDLAPSKNVKIMREEAEEDFLNYARD